MGSGGDSGTVGGYSSLYGRGCGVTEIDRICYDERDAVCDETARTFFSGRNLPWSKAYRGSGKCCESDECGGYLSFGRGASYGCGTFDRRMQ